MPAIWGLIVLAILVGVFWLSYSVSPGNPLISELETQKLENQISIGTGYVRVFSPSAHTVDIGSLRRTAHYPGRTLIIENAPTEVKKQFGAWGDLGSTTTLMERIKQQLDPDHLLSPGRFSANI